MTMTTVAVQLSMRLRESFGVNGKPKWPDPEDSVGRYYRRFGLADCWEAKGLARETYFALSNEIKTLLDIQIEFLNQNEPVSKTVTFGLYMTGRKPTNARPTIMFCCELPRPRRKARDLVRESGLLDEHPSWVLGDASFPPEFTQAPVQFAKSDVENIAEEAALIEDEASVLFRPTNKAYGIEIYVKDYGDLGAIRKSTVGGILRAEGRYFGLTVAHIFGERTPPAKAPDNGGFEFDLEEIDEGSDEDDEDLAEETSKGSQSSKSERSRTPGTSRRSSRTPESEEISSDITSKNETNLFDNNHDMSETINLDSIDSLGSSSSQTITTTDLGRTRVFDAYFRQDQSLVAFGNLSASSNNSRSASLDWALLQILDSQVKRYNYSSSSSRTRCFINFEWAMCTKPRDARIIIATGSGGLLSGMLSGTPTFLHLPQSMNFQEVWTVSLEGCLEYGDCGAWVFDVETGGLYGHIVSGDPISGVAYIIPAGQIYQDISLRLGTKDIDIFMGAESQLMLNNQWVEKTIQDVVREALHLQEVNLLNEVISEDNKRWEAWYRAFTSELKEVQGLVASAKTARSIATAALNQQILTNSYLKDQNKRLSEDLEISNDMIGRLRKDWTKTRMILRYNRRAARELGERTGTLFRSPNSTLMKRNRDLKNENLESEAASKDFSSPLIPKEQKNLMTYPPELVNSVSVPTSTSTSKYPAIIPRSSISFTLLSTASGLSGSAANLTETPNRAQAEDAPFRPSEGQDLSEAAITQSALSRFSARISVGRHSIELNYGPIGSKARNYRVLISRDEEGNQLFRHAIYLYNNEKCFPYTSNLKSADTPLMVTFKYMSPIRHIIEFKGKLFPRGIPKYSFANTTDFIRFQEEVRGKQLIGYFQCRRIESDSRLESINQHLKIWKDRQTNIYSLSYDADMRENPCDIEFLITMFREEIKIIDRTSISLNFFPIENSSLRSRRFANRNSVANSTYSASSASSIFSSAARSARSSVVTTSTRPSSAWNDDLQLDHKQTLDLFMSEEEAESTSLEPVEGLFDVEVMKYLRIDFLNMEEALNFTKIYKRVYIEGKSQPPISNPNWLAQESTAASSVLPPLESHRYGNVGDIAQNPLNVLSPHSESPFSALPKTPTFFHPGLTEDSGSDADTIKPLSNAQEEVMRKWAVCFGKRPDKRAMRFLELSSGLNEEQIETWWNRKITAQGRTSHQTSLHQPSSKAHFKGAIQPRESASYSTYVYWKS